MRKRFPVLLISLLSFNSCITDTVSPTQTAPEVHEVKHLTAHTEATGVVTINLDTVYQKVPNYWEVYENNKLAARNWNFHWVDRTPSEEYMIKRFNADGTLIDSHTIKVETNYPLEGITYPTENTRLFTRGSKWCVMWNPQSFSDNNVIIKFKFDSGESEIETRENNGEVQLLPGCVSITVSSQYTATETYHIDRLQYDFIPSNNERFVGEIPASYTIGEKVNIGWEYGQHYGGELHLVRCDVSEYGRRIEKLHSYKRTLNPGFNDTYSGRINPFDFPEVESGIYYWFISDGEGGVGSMSTPFFVN